MNTHGHYDVRRGGPDGYIQRLVCMHCNFFVARGEVSGAPAPNWDGQTRSGTPRYNRMRAKIVKHLHDKHRDALANPPPTARRDP